MPLLLPRQCFSFTGRSRPGSDVREGTRTVPPGPLQNRNRIHGFYSHICFSKITKSRCVFPVILRNKKVNRHKLNLSLIGPSTFWFPLRHENCKSGLEVTIPYFKEPLQLIKRRKIAYHSSFSLASKICFPISRHTELWNWKYVYPKLL
jgi:hypothetical protein